MVICSEAFSRKKVQMRKFKQNSRNHVTITYIKKKKGNHGTIKTIQKTNSGLTLILP